MLEKFTTHSFPEKSILDYLKKEMNSCDPDNLGMIIKMGQKDWGIMREYVGTDLDVETNRVLIENGRAGYIYGASINIEDREDIVFILWEEQ